MRVSRPDSRLLTPCPKTSISVLWITFGIISGLMDWKTIIAAAALILALLALLHQLIIKRRDATIEAQDREMGRLKTLLDEAKILHPMS